MVRLLVFLALLPTAARAAPLRDGAAACGDGCTLERVGGGVKVTAPAGTVVAGRTRTTLADKPVVVPLPVSDDQLWRVRLDQLAVLSREPTDLAAPITVTSPAGAATTIDVALSRSDLTMAVIERLRDVAKAPVTLGNEPAYAGKARGVWLGAWTPIGGAATTVAELDRIAIEDELPGTVKKCPRFDDTGDLSCLGAKRCQKPKAKPAPVRTYTVRKRRMRVFDRRTGKVVATKVFTDTRGDQLCSIDPEISVLGSDEPPAAALAWARAQR